MKRSYTLIQAAAVACWLGTVTVLAQETIIVPTPPKTRLEAMEAQTGTVIVKGTALIGTLVVGTSVLTVRCKEYKDVSRNRKEYGITVTINEKDRPEETTLVDYDELDALIGGLDFLAKADHSVTALPGFDASYKTRGELRIDTFSRKSTGTIEAAVQTSHPNKTSIVFSLADLARFRQLVEQAKSRLDGIPKEK